MTKKLDKLKLGLMAFAAFGLTAGVASSVDASPYKRKQRITEHQYRTMKRANLRDAMRDFTRMDINRDGRLSRRDFIRYQRPQYRWQRTRTGWRRVPVRTQRVDTRKWRELRRTADVNRDRRITLSEYRRARTRGFERRIAANYIVMRTYRPNRPLPPHTPYRPARH